MNTRQIMYKYVELEKELKELKDSMNLIYEEVGRGTKVYALLERTCADKQKEFNMFCNKEWVEE